MSHDAAMLERVLRQVTGECRVCGCHGDSCSLPEGERCVWVDKMRSLCSSPPCLVAACKQRRSHKFAVERAQRDSAAHGPRKRTQKRKAKGRAA